MSERYQVYWKNKRNASHHGHGEPVSKAVAEAAVDRYNKDWVDIDHWIEAVPEGEELRND